MCAEFLRGLRDCSLGCVGCLLCGIRAVPFHVPRQIHHEYLNVTQRGVPECHAGQQRASITVHRPSLPLTGVTASSTEEAKLKLIDHASRLDQGTKDILEMMFPEERRNYQQVRRSQLENCRENWPRMSFQELAFSDSLHLAEVTLLESAKDLCACNNA